MVLKYTNNNYIVPPIHGSASATPSFGNIVVDANDEALGVVAQAPYDTTIAKIGFRTGTLTTGDILTGRIEGVSAGAPSDSLLAAGAEGTVNATTANTSYEITLTTPVAVTRGSKFAVVVKRVSPSTFQGNLTIYQDSNVMGRPSVHNRTTAWTVTLSGSSMFYLVDNNGDIIPLFHTHPFADLAQTTFTTTLLRGVRFTADVDCEVDGITVWGDFDQDVTIEAYNHDGVTIDTTVTNASNEPSTTAATVNYIAFSAPVPINANEHLYIVGKTASGTAALYGFSFANADVCASYTGGRLVAVETSDTTPSGPSDFTVTDTAVRSIHVHVSAIDVPTASSGGSVGYVG